MCRGKCNLGWGFLPLCTGLTMAVGILTTYTIAAARNDVAALLPTISDTGIMGPEMHIFSQVLNVSAVLVMVTLLIRFKMIHTIASAEHSSQLKVISVVSLIIGIIAAIGLSIVGNFQDNTAVDAHSIGAFMAFFLGNVYAIIDAVVTKKMHPRYNGITIFWVRVCISSLGIVAFVVCISGCAASPWNPEYKLHWKPSDPGYAAHLVFTFGEWTMGFAFISYFFTYVVDFTKFSLELNIIMKVAHLSQDPDGFDVAEHGGYEPIISSAAVANNGNGTHTGGSNGSYQGLMTDPASGNASLF